MPLEFIVPPDADQLTAVLVVPATLAVNCWVFPACSEIEFGVTLTFTDGSCWVPEEANVQPARETSNRERSARTSFCMGVCSATCSCGWSGIRFDRVGILCQG